MIMLTTLALCHYGVLWRLCSYYVNFEHVKNWQRPSRSYRRYWTPTTLLLRSSHVENQSYTLRYSAAYHDRRNNCPPPLFCQLNKLKNLKTTTYKSVYSNKTEIGSYLSRYWKSHIY